jgi:hypothetical protein
MMKKFTLIIVMAFGFLSADLFGQGANPNVVKMNLGGLVFQNLSFQFERAVSNKVSLALGVSFMPERNVPSMIVGDGQDISRISLSDFSVTPELRWYPTTGDGAPQGFYFAPYIRYTRFSMTMPHTNVKSGKEFTLNGTFTGMGAGLMIGYQWLISDKFSVDWWLMGVHGGSASVNLVIDSPDLNDPTLDKDDLTRTLGNMDLPMSDTPEVTYSGSTATIKFAAPYIGFRPGLTIGYAF